MSRKPSTSKPDGPPRKLRKVSGPGTFAAVQATFLEILKRRDQATADAIREQLDIPADGWPAIGRAIADLHRQKLIQLVAFGVSIRGAAHGRALRIWRLTR